LQPIYDDRPGSLPIVERMQRIGSSWNDPLFVLATLRMVRNGFGQPDRVEPLQYPLEVETLSWLASFCATNMKAGGKLALT